MTHLPATAHGVLQPGRRDGWRRARHGDARGGVDNGNGVTAAGGRWLVDLHARMLRLVAGRDEGGRGRVEGEAGGNGLRLLRGRGFRRVAGERGALRRTGNGDQLIPMASSQKNCKLQGDVGRELTSLSVNKPGQNSRSSSRSKDRPASNLLRKELTEATSAKSFIVRPPRICLWVFWETERRGARRLRPPALWWPIGAGCAGCAL
jgi:hypothetical protein